MEPVDQGLRLIGLRRLAGEARERVGGRARRKGRQDREPERAADLLRRVEQPGGEAGVLVRDAVVAISVSGTNVSPMPIDVSMTPAAGLPSRSRRAPSRRNRSSPTPRSSSR